MRSFGASRLRPYNNIVRVIIQFAIITQHELSYKATDKTRELMLTFLFRSGTDYQVHNASTLDSLWETLLCNVETKLIG